MVCIEKDDKVNRFFNKYTILKYDQAFEDAIDINVKNILYLETLNKDLVPKLMKEYSNIYVKAEDLTSWKIELLDDISNVNEMNSLFKVSNENYNSNEKQMLSTSTYYPNDYGSNSPNPNLGHNYNNKAYDYINVPKAWFFTRGIQDIKIGISDLKIDYLDNEFLNKITPIDGYVQQSIPNSHGTGVAAIAAAHGNNSFGNVGVCMNCNIVEGPTSIGGPQTVYSNLYKMVLKGARVINMSWTNSGYINTDINSPYYYNPSNFPLTAEQMVINDLVNNYNVVLVAAAGNRASFQTPTSNFNTNCNGPFGIYNVFPASYDNVISVSSIRYYNEIALPLNQSQPSYLGTSPFFDIHQDLENSLAWLSGALDPYNPIGIIEHGWAQNTPCNPFGSYNNHTLNENVDLVAPGTNMYWHPYLVSNNPNVNVGGSGTSCAAPLVSGTIGLMLSLNGCLNPKEIEDVLQLTTADIENLPINQNFHGYSGSGKLETGDAVEFTYEMMNSSGNAVIDGQDFWRFSFDLQRINNKLTISNQVFRDGNISNFVAKNSIDVTTNSDFKPNSNGFIDLKIDSDITVCPVAPRLSEKNQNESKSEMVSKGIKLYPNPNTGTFTISLNKSISDIDITVFDTFGKLIYQTNKSGKDLELSIPNLPSGLYIVKLNSNELTETLKFLKQ